jgi:hypothetical protein
MSDLTRPSVWSLEVQVLLALLLSCTARINVVASVPEAEIGVLRSTSQPPAEDLIAEVRGTGEVQATVPYSILDTWWVWARLPGGEATVQRYPTVIAGGPLVGCILVWVPCLWVTKPMSRPVHIEVSRPAPSRPPPVPTIVVAPPPPPPPPPSPTAGCTKDTDCKGDRICVDGSCTDP